MVDAEEGKLFGQATTFLDLAATLRQIDRLEGFRPNEPGASHYARSAYSHHGIPQGRTWLLLRLGTPPAHRLPTAAPDGLGPEVILPVALTWP